MEAFAWRWIFSLLSCHDFKLLSTWHSNTQLVTLKIWIRCEIPCWNPILQCYSNCRFDPNCPKLHPNTLEQLSETQGMWAPGHFNLSETTPNGVAVQMPTSPRCHGVPFVPFFVGLFAVCHGPPAMKSEVKPSMEFHGFGIWKTPLHLWWPTQTRQSHEYIWPRSKCSKTSTNSHPHTRTYTHIHICRLCWKVNKNISRSNMTESNATVRVPTGGWTNTWCHMNEWNQWVICFETNCWYPCSRISITEANNNISSNYNTSTSTRRIESLPELRPLLKSMCLTEQWKKIAKAHGHTASRKEIGENSKVRNSKSGKMVRQPWGIISSQVHWRLEEQH